MIGVISKAGQSSIVEEFFELFKTPWESYCPEKAYDVVIATVDDPPRVQASVLVVYSSVANAVDTRFGFTAGERKSYGTLNDRDGLLPLYKGLLTFLPVADGAVCVTTEGMVAGVRMSSPDGVVIRVGYDLFDEVAFLLSAGQPVEHAQVPALDIHIRQLREWILETGIFLLEIPPLPVSRSFIVCLTHDIDFISITRHCLDHSMWGFVFRATVGALRNFARGRLSLRRMLLCWRAVASLPFVFAGWAKDFWEPFEWYLKVEKDLSPTYFVIPFKGRAGERVPGRHASRRAAAYGVTDLREQVQNLRSHGCEIGVHGIDSWHDVEKGHAERSAVREVAGECSGIRMHWLLHDENTPAVLDRAGYTYDSTCGYNETVGYRAGTGQPFRPPGARTLLELPLHVQDGALFYPQRLDCSEREADKLCKALIANAQRFGGALTLLWHDRSHGPERFWGDFYKGLIQKLQTSNCWFATVEQAVGWFRQRRAVQFEAVETGGTQRIRLRCEGGNVQPPLRIRLYHPTVPGRGTTEPMFDELEWNGKPVGIECNAPLSSSFPDCPSVCSRI